MEYHYNKTFFKKNAPRTTILLYTLGRERHRVKLYNVFYLIGYKLSLYISKSWKQAFLIHFGNKSFVSD